MKFILSYFVAFYRSRREMYTRSLGRTRRQGFESGRSSDGESSKHDPEELQRARAHLKETLEGKIEKLRKIEAEKQLSQNETKAVVHRSDSQHVSVSGSKTLDSDAIKQYQNIKQNAAAVGGKQQRYSGMFGDKNKERLSSSSTASRTDHQTSRSDLQAATPSIYKQNSYDNITSRNTEAVVLSREKYEGDYKGFHVSHKIHRNFIRIQSRYTKSHLYSPRVEETR